MSDQPTFAQQFQAFIPKLGLEDRSKFNDLLWSQYHERGTLNDFFNDIIAAVQSHHPITAESIEELRRFWNNPGAGGKIGAIKHVRQITPLGLKEAKDLVEAIFNDQPQPTRPAPLMRELEDDDLYTDDRLPWFRNLVQRLFSGTETAANTASALDDFNDENDDHSLWETLVDFMQVAREEHRVALSLASSASTPAPASARPSAPAPVEVADEYGFKEALEAAKAGYRNTAYVKLQAALGGSIFGNKGLRPLSYPQISQLVDAFAELANKAEQSEKAELTADYTRDTYFRLLGAYEQTSSAEEVVRLTAVDLGRLLHLIQDQYDV